MHETTNAKNTLKNTKFFNLSLRNTQSIINKSLKVG